MERGLAVRRESGGGEPVRQLGAGGRAVGGQGVGDHRLGGVAEGLVEAEFAVPAGAQAEELRAEQGEQPAQVGGGDGVQGAAQQPAPDQGAVDLQGPPQLGRGEPGGADPDAQRPGPGVLGLDADDPFDGLGCGAEADAGAEALPAGAQGPHQVVVQGR